MVTSEMRPVSDFVVDLLGCVCRGRRGEASAAVEVEAEGGRVCWCREAAREHGGRGPHDV